MFRLVRHSKSAAAAWALLALLTAAPAVAGPQLLVAAEDARALPQQRDPLVLRERKVRISLDLLRPDARSVTVPLFDGASIEALPERREATRDEGFVWIGRIAGQPQSLVVFSVLEGVLVGDIRTDKGELYQIRFLGGGAHVLRQINPRAYPPEGEPGEVELAASDPATTAAAACPMTDPADQIDAMIVYTPAARNAAGGAVAMEAEAFLAVATANVTYLQSGVNQRLRLVHVAEVPYTETPGTNVAAMIQDRDRLRHPSDIHLDNVHTLRDAHGADVVALLGEYPGNYPLCGIAYVMSTVTTSFAGNGFAVIQRSCASGNLTFPHELGHIMSARHEWTADPTNNSPFTFNHAHFYPPGAWRTVMATGNAGSGCCNRIPYWSNPNQTYSGVAMGIATGNQQADNRKTLNQTAHTVANFRCSSPGRSDVWMKDTWNDTGVEPDPLTAAEEMWKSPSIWVRASGRDTTLVHQHQHEDPKFGSTNWVYAKLQNAGGAAMSGNLELWVVQAAPYVPWGSSAWTQIASVPTTVPAHGVKIAEAQWANVPGTGHYCMLARWVATADPMTHPETADFGANTRNNNNIVWRNLNIIKKAGFDQPTEVSLQFRNPQARRADYTLAVRPARGDQKAVTFLRLAAVQVELGPDLHRSWVRGGKRGKGFKAGPCRSFVPANGQGIVFEKLVLEPGQVSTITLTFTRPRRLPAGTYHLDVVQIDTKTGKELGGVGYEIRVGPEAPAPAPGRAAQR